MFNPNEVIAYIKSFLVFCLEHPYLSIPVAFILLVGLVAHFFETVKVFIEFVVNVQKKGSTAKKAALWVGLASMIVLSIRRRGIHKAQARHPGNAGNTAGEGFHREMGLQERPEKDDRL